MLAKNAFDQHRSQQTSNVTNVYNNNKQLTLQLLCANNYKLQQQSALS